ncbi:MAG: hypothetical protein A2149_01655 [Candidatus Schekmanbacteria bacterium RBG_16_38_11]|uniref:prephenate dehydrogenase n=1 Tax=Candidatus Schekmanbacteria bacterium RBG_16_38_11 TaxID=1817880 RepID=A0A1F7S180_9BACT|nr:MAG: hypothetical protein A2149_01655 [Candidatus Schekmanbacteria bacterium RBG_16_38_11]
MGFLFNKIAIVGVGMIGGSLAMAIKKKGIAREILGIDIDRKNLDEAKKSGIIDYALNFKSKTIELQKVRLIIVATPVRSIPRAIEKLSPWLDEGTIITDTGSVKGSVVKDIEDILQKGVFFIGGHPIAGSELSGVKSASGDLFAGAKIILTPTGKNSSPALRKVKEFWTRLGSKVILMKPKEHDRVFAAVSHLPHILAFSLVNTLSELHFNNQNPFKFAGEGFKDFTRIAQSNPSMWHDIVLENKDQILDSMDHFMSTFEKIKSLIEKSEGKKIRKEFSKAQKLRKKLS